MYIAHCSLVTVGDDTVMLETLACSARLQQNYLLCIFCSGKPSVYHSSPPVYETTVTKTGTVTIMDTMTSVLADTGTANETATATLTDTITPALLSPPQMFAESSLSSHL